MDEFSPKIRALIERSRTDDEPRAVDRDRMRRKLAVAAAPFAGGVGASLAAKSAAAASGAKAASVGALAVVKWTAGTVLALAVSVGAYETMETRSAPSRRTSAEAVTAPESAPAKTEPKKAEKLGKMPSPSGAATPQVRAPSQAVEDGSRRPRALEKAGVPSLPVIAPADSRDAGRSEVDLLALAQSKLTMGQAGEALELVAAHRREFPKSALGAERIAVRVLALCQLGRTGEAESALDEFERVAPASPLRPRLLGSCAGARRKNGDFNTIPPLTGN